MSSATNSHNYLYESWTVNVNGPLFLTSVCAGFFTPLHPRIAHRHLTLSHNFYSLTCGGYINRFESALLRGCVCVSPKTTLPNVTQPDVVHGLVRKSISSIVSMSKHKRVVEPGFLRSGSPQGLSSPMLVVIFLSCHCSLLCSPSFLIILSAIYQTMKSERNKKKKNLSFLCIMAYVKFFEEKKCFVCSLFPCRKKKKKKSLSVEKLSTFFFILFLFLLILKKVVIVLREAKVNAFQWIL